MRWIIWIVAGIGDPRLLIVVVIGVHACRRSTSRRGRRAVAAAARSAVRAAHRRGPLPVVAAGREGADASAGSRRQAGVDGGRQRDEDPAAFERMERPRCWSRASPIRRCRSAAPGPIGLRRRPAAERLTITEDGEVYNPFFRFMSRFVFGQTATLDEFVRNLEGAREMKPPDDQRDEFVSTRSRIEKLGVKPGQRGARARRRGGLHVHGRTARARRVRPHRRQQGDGRDLRPRSTTATICAACGRSCRG